MRSRASRSRTVPKVDVGYGSHFSFRMARIALDAGIVPDTLGADMHGYNTTVPKPAGTPDEHPDKDHMFAGTTRFSLVSAMTAMLALGLPLEHVVAMVNDQRANMVGMDDISRHARSRASTPTCLCFDDERGRWVLKDNEGTQVVADRMLTPSFCLSRGLRYEADASILPTGSPRDRHPLRAWRRRTVAPQGRRALPARPGQFVGDIRRAGMLEVAFVRSPVAHARIGSIEKPAGLEDRVWTMADLDDVKPIRAVSALEGFKASDLWPLARTRCGTSAKRSRCVSARRALKPKTSPRRYASITKSCRRWST